MFHKFGWLTAAALLLTGCVLESPAELFPDAKGELILKPLGTRFGAEMFDKGQWKADEGEMTFTPKDHHYVASNSKDSKTMDLLFVPLGKARYVMQVHEPDQPYGYLIAEVKGGHLQLQPLLCDELKKLPGSTDAITFEGGDCNVKGTPDIGFFNGLADGVTPARMRLVPLK